MGFINVAERTLSAKLVYYGVGVGGKTTSLQQVHGIFCPRNEVQLVSINTEEDSTLLFDFLPINLGQVSGFKIKIQGFTVPGQPKYRQMRKYVLQGADAVVFVVDSQRSRLQENLDSLQSMRQHLRTNGTPEDIPIVVQYNKRDLPDILSEGELDEKFKFREGIPAFPSVATEGQGVFEAFVEAATLLIEKKVARYGIGREGEDPHAVAEGVREKLWNICDTVRRDRAAVAIDKLPQTRLALPDGADGADGATHSGTLAEHAPPAPRMSLAPLDEGDVELSYELRDSTGASDEEAAHKKVFSDEELNHEIAAGAVQFHAPASEEVDDSLFDKTMLSNLELARRYGELDEQRLLLDRKVHELVEVAQQTVHDLNRPLSAIRLMLSTLAKGYLGQLSEPVNQAVDNGLQAVHQMERLLRDLLDSSRLDCDGIKLTFADCDLTLLLAEVLRTLRYEIEETGVRVLVEPMPCIVADSWALTKVFMNLLGNAIQYGPNDKQPVIQVSCHETDDEWIVEVRDNGIGIPDKDKSRLFRRFERGSNTGGISGTGLGLHIVKEIVQGHGGSVRFDSAVGSGTTFFLHVPKAPRLAPHSVVSETAARADL